MREVFSALWSTVTLLITGSNGYIKAYANIGDIAAQATDDFKLEEAALSKIRRAELDAKYSQVLLPKD